MSLYAGPEPAVESERTRAAGDEWGAPLAAVEKSRPRRRTLVVATVAALVALLVGGVGGGLIGSAIGSAVAEEEQAQAIADLRDDVAELESASATLEDDNASLQESLAWMEDQMGACQVAAMFAAQIIANRQEALDLEMDETVPLDELGVQLLEMDSEFARLTGQFDLASAVCGAPTGGTDT